MKVTLFAHAKHVSGFGVQELVDRQPTFLNKLKPISDVALVRNEKKTAL